jgi:hypothetical protein
MKSMTMNPSTPRAPAAKVAAPKMGKTMQPAKPRGGVMAKSENMGQPMDKVAPLVAAKSMGKGIMK